MANISVKIETQEMPNDFNLGSYHVKIAAGLNEEPEQIMEEALKRINSAIQALPPEKRYSRYRDFEKIQVLAN